MSDLVIAVLTGAGFSGPELAHASGLLMSYAIGSAVTDAAVRNTTTRAGKSVTDLVAEMEPLHPPRRRRLPELLRVVVRKP